MQLNVLVVMMHGAVPFSTGFWDVNILSMAGMVDIIASVFRGDIVLSPKFVLFLCATSGGEREDSWS